MKRRRLILSFIIGFIVCLLLMLIIINKPNQQQKLKKNYYLICIIFTSINNYERRNCIRNTWLNLVSNNLNVNVKYYFIIGINNLSESLQQKLQNEQLKHNDLLLLNNLLDTYNNLTLKLLQTFEWINENYNFKYLIKVDDDSFLRIDEIYKLLLNRIDNDNRPLYWGFFDGRAKVKTSGIWKENDWFLCDHYLPYALGGGYVLSKDLIEFISNNSHWLQLYNSEDVSLGTWLSPLKIQRLHDINFDTEYKSRGCLNTFLIQHKQSVDDMKIKYNSLIQNGYLCVNQYEQRLTYQYNWQQLPSKCCIRNKTMLPT